MIRKRLFDSGQPIINMTKKFQRLKTHYNIAMKDTGEPLLLVGGRSAAVGIGRSICTVVVRTSKEEKGGAEPFLML